MKTMRKSLISFITLIYLLPHNVNAQKNGAIAAAGALVAIGAGIAAVSKWRKELN